MSRTSNKMEGPSLTSVEGSNLELAVSSTKTVNKAETQSQTLQLPPTNPDIRRFSASSSLAGYGVLDLAGADAGDAEPSADDLRNDSSSVIRFYPEWCRCFECLRNKTPYSPHATCAEHCREVFLCPPQGPTARIIAFVLVFVFGWIFCWFLLEKMNTGYDDHRLKKKDPEFERPSPASPFGPLFALGILELVGLFFGILMKIIHLPALLGPLILGIALRNIDLINLFKMLRGNLERCVHQIYFEQFNPPYKNYTPNETYYNQTLRKLCENQVEESITDWIKPIRQIALTMILTRAGLELSPKQLKKLKGVVPLLAFGPCIVEACFCALFTWAAFSSTNTSNGTDYMDILMCFVCGFALAAVSPAVVVPGMLSLKRKNLGTAQGIPTLLIAASSIDDVLAISAYTIFLSLVLAKSDEYMGYVGGPLSIVVGIVHGFIVGPFLHFIPSRDTRNKGLMRLILLLLFNFCAMFGYEIYEPLSGAGSLSVLVTSFIASFGWRSQPHWKKPMHKIEKTLAHIWTLCVPLLFGTIGKEIDFTTWKGSRIWRVLLVIFASLIVRCFTAFMIVWIMKLNVKERLFCAMAWVPKATVQAALAPLVITKVHEWTGPDNRKKALMNQAEIVVTTAVLAILITAPLGSCLIAFFGPRLLKVAAVPEKVVLDAEFPHGDGNDPADPVFSLEDIHDQKRISRISAIMPALPTSSKEITMEEGTTTSFGDVKELPSSGSFQNFSYGTINSGSAGSIKNFNSVGSVGTVQSGSLSNFVASTSSTNIGAGSSTRNFMSDSSLTNKKTKANPKKQ